MINVIGLTFMSKSFITDNKVMKYISVTVHIVPRGLGL